ncbi:HisA/HisF-related TIM barrel protein [Caballeronia sp. LZ034LL]|uniref:HisA/HisF-related TIM barrel protein n=1 Tax=Caballeronia sp. LZ034LL TaxID=3038567 RepID=UPI002865F66F|nr:HisA/HisF-related TIM barrel protein [Caballeronia sp. LZ034LL]MDR5837737.1 HisA/HisF-related TIM barrel protein [Caballeronia sp. LZ034LL]
MSFTLYPSVDIVASNALTSRTAIAATLGHDMKAEQLGSPVDLALAFQDAGARWIHVVDLDAAAGKGNNRHLIIELLKRVKANVQVCGGIRTESDVAQLIDAGCARINIGTAALDNPHWCETLFRRYGEKIAIALDVRESDSGYTLTSRGWNDESGDLWPKLATLDELGCPRYVVTDVNRGGTMNHPNLRLLEAMKKRTCKPIVSGGGVSSIGDIFALEAIGVEGTVLGQALHCGSLSYGEIEAQLGQIATV